MGRYPEVLAEMNEIVSSEAYELVDLLRYGPVRGEFCDESIFEVRSPAG